MTRRVPVTAVVVAAMAVAFGLTVPAAQSAESFDVVVKANPVSLRMSTSEGTSEVSSTALLDKLQSAEARTRISISRSGSGLARERLLTALGDGAFTGAEDRAIVSGSPFTADELAGLSGVKLVGVPVHAVGSAILLSGPGTGNGQPAGFVTQFIDPLLGFPDGTVEVDKLDGPHPTDASTLQFKMPWPALANQVLEVGDTTWTGMPGLLASWGYAIGDDGLWRKPGSDRYLALDAAPLFSPRFEPSSMNLYVQEALATVAPTIWRQKFAGADPNAKVPAPSERFLGGSRSSVRSRGMGELVRILGDPGYLRPGGGQPTNGTLVSAPMWITKMVHDAYPDVAGVRALQLSVAELQNGAGQWTVPTSDSITKAIAAGGEQPLYALTNKVPDAYPLSWVESMYLPSKGLGIDEVNGLSAYARLLVTDGQTVVKGDGDGVLTSALVNKALTAINDAVTSNCTAADGVPVTQKESPYYPPAAEAPKMAALSAQVVCGTKVAIATTTTTSTTAATTTTTAATTTTTRATTTTVATTSATVRAATQGSTARTTPAARSTPSASPTVPTATTAAGGPTTVASTTTVAAVPAPTTSPPTNGPAAPETAVVRTVLPLGLPAASLGGFDRFLTMAMGGALLLLVRRALLTRKRLAT